MLKVKESYAGSLKATVLLCLIYV